MGQLLPVYWQQRSWTAIVERGMPPARVAFLDCFSGVSGDMLLGALVDCGLELAWLRAALRAGLPDLTGYEVAAETIEQHGIAGTRVTVIANATGGRDRDWAEVRALLQSSSLPARPRALALRIFERLARAEAQVHGVPVEAVHFHEVGAVDAIVDIVGAALGFDRLGIEAFYASSLTDGRGFTRSRHGVIPVPVPATAALLAMAGAPSRGAETELELVTPTGAAVVTTLAQFCRPEFSVTKVGYGFGQRELPWPNALRLWIGELTASAVNSGVEYDDTVVLETNIDDMNPQFYSPLLARLFDAGALDAFLTPVIMKKGRPGVVVTVLASPERAGACTELLLTETTSLGVRQRTERRVKAPRTFEVVTTPWGPATVKLKHWAGQPVAAVPEFEDSRALAEANNVPLGEVHATVARLGAELLARMRVTSDDAP